MERNSTPSKTSIVLSDEEFAKRSAPGGKLAVATAKSNPYADPKYSQIGEATPNAVAAKAEREHARARPDLVQKRASKGK
jgi:hypothetical protein